ncbi:MAG: sulfatase-like hydrolase/transferase [bacterium]
MNFLCRRDFLKVAGAGGLAAMMPLAAQSEQAAQKYPNIVFILADDMGFGDLACQNPDTKIPTPCLDQLAKEGIRFTDAHSPSAVCSPTRYSILTGRYAWRSRLKDSVLWPWDAPLIEPGRLTVAQLLKQHGYNTACIGKWHLGWDWATSDGSRMNDQIPVGKYDDKIRTAFGKKIDFTQPIANGPTQKGFDYYFGDDVPNFSPYCFIENDRTIGIPTEEKPDSMFGTPGPMLKGWKLDEVMPALTRKAVEFIKAKPGQGPFNKSETKPFFLYFPLTAPHTPIAPAPEFKGKSQADGYGDYVYQVDWTVGQVLKALDESGQVDNTLVIFTSDNGSPGRDGTDMAGPPNSVRKYGHNPSYIYRGIKADAWDGGHRVPFLARWPKHIQPGSTSDEIICHVDFMATCATLLGYALPDNAGEDSYNILPALLGEKSEKPIREATVHHSINGMFAIRQGKWKLILGRGSGGWSKESKEADPPMQLYDVYGDPSETINLYAKHPEIVEQLTNLLEKYKKEGRSARF